GQGHPCVHAGGPPRKAPLRESLHHDPVALTVIEQEFERGARAIAKDVDGALQGIVAEALSAHCGESIDALAEIDRLRGQKDAALRAELKHHDPSKKARTTATTGKVDSGHRTRRHDPSG